MVTCEVECSTCVFGELFASVLSLFLRWAAHPVILINERFTECRLLPALIVVSPEAFCASLDFAQRVFCCKGADFSFLASR